ncbi:putative sensor-like histidine kinase [Dissostichus eleginoides]|uniref:Sensor-like histidine kinase n=1 Tax=Dissostichus eleginoides TaxID=100907 RepID=A0AAD9EXH3_DISEL|nr:putative sensor-like histidine kinase [Dissostichus eleginoides]
MSRLSAPADAHAFNRKVLKLIHSKPAALRVVYYKRVFSERPPPDEACTSTVSLSNRNTNRHHSASQFPW